MSGDLASALEALAAHASVNSLDASGYARTRESQGSECAARGGASLTVWRLPIHAAVNIAVALHQAVMRRDARFIAFLLANGADPNVPARDGRTALHLATLAKHNRCVGPASARASWVDCR